MHGVKKELKSYFDFDHPPNRWGSDSLKWGTYAGDVLPMWVADMDFRSPPAIIKALRECVDHGVFGYPLGIDGSPKQNTEIRLTLVERLERLYRWRIEPEMLVFIPGVVVGFNLACRLFASQGGSVLLQTPVYHPILHAPENAGMNRHEARLIPDQDLKYEIEWDSLTAGIDEHTRIFILCNPHNPVGKVFSSIELERMAEICLKHQILICSDEIHCDLIYPDVEHIPIASLDEEIAQNSITLMAPSKTFNIPGLQFAFAVIPNPELRKQYQNAAKGLVSWNNLFGWVAALAAYREGQDWLDQVLVYLQNNRDYLCHFVKTELPHVRTTKPQATYLAWLDFRQLNLGGSPFEFFLNNAKVAFNDGKVFGLGGEGFVRLNFGCSRALLEEVLGRVKLALQGVDLVYS